ncbi:hypothetical protein SDC9_96795 [bioreactor metagenome]|uniref:Uncharacterized protein n=1 Tax=bioreactor metagenome TaxID=1076179 RepID=A0A645ACQ3_9ZZZZ
MFGVPQLERAGPVVLRGLRCGRSGGPRAGYGRGGAGAGGRAEQPPLGGGVGERGAIALGQLGDVLQHLVAGPGILEDVVELGGLAVGDQRGLPALQRQRPVEDEVLEQRVDREDALGRLRVAEQLEGTAGGLVAATDAEQPAHLLLELRLGRGDQVPIGVEQPLEGVGVQRPGPGAAQRLVDRLVEPGQVEQAAHQQVAGGAVEVGVGRGVRPDPHHPGAGDVLVEAVGPGDRGG